MLVSFPENVKWKIYFRFRWVVCGASQLALVVKNPPAKAGDIRDVVQSLGLKDPLEEGKATHSSILAWRSPWTEEPDGMY